MSRACGPRYGPLANSSSYLNLALAVDTAAAMGAHVISDSYGGSESGTSSYERYYGYAGIAVTVSSGDSGYGVQFPAASPHVTAVGGTSLRRSSSARGWSGHPLIAGVYGVNGGSVAYGTDPYSHTSSLYDVISGSNGSCGGSYLCTAVPGYDGPTGLGRPNGTTAF